MPDDHLEPSHGDDRAPNRPRFALGHWVRACGEHPEALATEERGALQAVLRGDPHPPLRPTDAPGLD